MRCLMSNSTCSGSHWSMEDCCGCDNRQRQPHSFVRLSFQCASPKRDTNSAYLLRRSFGQTHLVRVHCCVAFISPPTLAMSLDQALLKMDRKEVRKRSASPISRTGSLETSCFEIEILQDLSRRLRSVDPSCVPS